MAAPDSLPPDSRLDFSATRWSLVAMQDSDAHTSLMTLCERYWHPVYAYLRHSGHAPEHAHALTRAFFRHLSGADEARANATRFGRFRLFLLAQLHRFLSTEQFPDDAADTVDAPPLEQAEARLRADAAPGQSPELTLQRGFAQEILGVAQLRLCDEARQAGRLGMFEVLQRFLSIEPHPGEYEVIAKQLGVRPLLISIAVKRLRQRFRELVDAELGETLASAADLASERELMLRVLADPSR